MGHTLVAAYASFAEVAMKVDHLMQSKIKCTIFLRFEFNFSHRRES